MESQPISKDAAKDIFMHSIKNSINYWSKLDDRNTKEKLEGLAFSILNIFDGTSSDMPALDIVLRPHEDDKKFREEEGDDYFVDGMCINDESMLHEEFYA